VDSDRQYKVLLRIAILLTLAWVGWSAYDSFVAGRGPGDDDYFAAEKYFEDGDYQAALEGYRAALSEAPDHLAAQRGLARSLMQLERYDEAEVAFNRAIAEDPDFGGTYANRGILFDRTGRYREAIADYEKALSLDPDLGEGPHWLTRFLRNQPERPPTIADRAAYLKEQLALPEDQRVLRVPDQDRAQRPYKL
jgi:tetratricopeptide (TPR) repeat protein